MGLRLGEARKLPAVEKCVCVRRSDLTFEGLAALWKCASYALGGVYVPEMLGGISAELRKQTQNLIS